MTHPSQVNERKHGLFAMFSPSLTPDLALIPSSPQLYGPSLRVFAGDLITSPAFLLPQAAVSRLPLWGINRFAAAAIDRPLTRRREENGDSRASDLITKCRCRGVTSD
ncbi:hypothetical protein L596_016538 [Steinernema carpocapsae]|uniref:Uncharacterized protein n=1 Tax=Steinernema carpocapsae TaxID=34508 RepID=A0A4U5NJ49_STECR|nr:hypothetical protein L596_016538 [Steinernema carpocapsae]